MNHIWIRVPLIICGLTEASLAHAAVDSYRFAHVTIATPWYIFIFLMLGVFAPFVLMAVLAWRNAVRKTAPESADVDNEPKGE
jgi:hypothetical protein